MILTPRDPIAALLLHGPESMTLSARARTGWGTCEWCGSQFAKRPRDQRGCGLLTQATLEERSACSRMTVSVLEMLSKARRPRAKFRGELPRCLGQGTYSDAPSSPRDRPSPEVELCPQNSEREPHIHSGNPESPCFRKAEGLGAEQRSSVSSASSPGLMDSGKAAKAFHRRYAKLSRVGRTSSQ